MSIDATASVWLRRKVFQPRDGGHLFFTMYFAAVVWPTSMPNLSSLPLNLPRSPHRVGHAHLANEPANTRGSLWPTAARS
jgi:hypothetical protein